MKPEIKTLKERLQNIAERLWYLGPKIDSGRFKYSEKQEKDKLVKEYLQLEIMIGEKNG